LPNVSDAAYKDAVLKGQQTVLNEHTWLKNFATILK
jgi:hypothetical protein